MSVQAIRDLLLASGIYTQNPSHRQFGYVKSVALSKMGDNRILDMALLDSLSQLYCKCGHKVDLIIINAGQMWQVCINAAKHIFEQMKKAKMCGPDALFDATVADLGNIKDGEKYYGDMVFVSSNASNFAMRGLKISACDASHMDGKGPQSHESYFEIVGYDHKNCLNTFL